MSFKAIAAFLQAIFSVGFLTPQPSLCASSLARTANQFALQGDFNRNQVLSWLFYSLFSLVEKVEWLRETRICESKEKDRVCTS